VGRRLEVHEAMQRHAVDSIGATGEKSDDFQSSDD